MPKVKKNFLCKIIFSVLCRGISVLNKNDPHINSDLAPLPDGYSIAFGILPYGTYLCMIKSGDRFYITKDIDKPNISINFKTVRAAKAVMLAHISVAESFAKHQLIVAGDIGVAVSLVRVINRTELYLFPRIMTRRILPKIKKSCSTLLVYLKILFKSFKLPKNGGKH